MAGVRAELCRRPQRKKTMKDYKTRDDKAIVIVGVVVQPFGVVEDKMYSPLTPIGQVTTVGVTEYYSVEHLEIKSGTQTRI